MKSNFRLGHRPARAAALLASFALVATSAFAVPVIVPDNGAGTAQMPILSDYLAEAPMEIVDGLPGGTTINVAALLKAPLLYEEVAGGSLGGTRAAGGGTLFDFQLTGTGTLMGFNRNILMPAGGVPLTWAAIPPLDSQAGFEAHAEPRTNYAPLQSFDTAMMRLFSQITGDPDFDLLRVTAGTDYGMPSPGHTTLLQDGGNWQVDSYFDITYRIDFVGAPGGSLAGRSGSTTRTVRFSLGDRIPIVPEPGTLALVGIATLALGMHHRRPRCCR